MPSACDSFVDDIEDMVTSYDPTPHERQFARRNIVPHARKNKQQPAGEELQTDRSETQLSHAVMLHCAPLLKLTQYERYCQDFTDLLVPTGAVVVKFCCTT